MEIIVVNKEGRAGVTQNSNSKQGEKSKEMSGTLCRVMTDEK